MNARDRSDPAASPAPAPAADVSPVLVSITDGVAWLTLNRPRQFNAISMEMLEAMQEALDALAVDPAVRVVVIAGAGKAFSGGHDLKQMMGNRNQAFIARLFDECSRVMLALQALPQPVIARVHGIATAAGCQLVSACDLAVASTDARFATSGINLGLFCATPGVPVSRNVSRKRAFEMLFTGEFIDATTACAWGLVNRVVAPELLDREVDGIVQSLRTKPRNVLAAGKAIFYRQMEAPLEEAYRAASRSITENMLGDEAAEGVGAFFEKRAPRWET